MFTERMTRVAAVPIFLITMGVPVVASAQTHLSAHSSSVVNVNDAIRSPNGAFVLDTIEQARTQRTPAHLAISDAGASDTRNLALQAQDLWTNVDNRLHEIAQALGIPTAVERDAEEHHELYRLQHIKERDFDSASARLLTRSCDALLERMDRLDPQIDSRLLFFVDGMLPKFGQMQMGIKNRYAYQPAQPLVL